MYYLENINLAIDTSWNTPFELWIR